MVDVMKCECRFCESYQYKLSLVNKKLNIDFYCKNEDSENAGMYTLQTDCCREFRKRECL